MGSLSHNVNIFKDSVIRKMNFADMALIIVYIYVGVCVRVSVYTHTHTLYLQPGNELVWNKKSPAVLKNRFDCSKVTVSIETPFDYCKSRWFCCQSEFAAGFKQWPKYVGNLLWDFSALGLLWPFTVTMICARLEPLIENYDWQPHRTSKVIWSEFLLSAACQAAGGKLILEFFI